MHGFSKLKRAWQKRNHGVGQLTDVASLMGALLVWFTKCKMLEDFLSKLANWFWKKDHIRMSTHLEGIASLSLPGAPSTIFRGQ